MFIRSFILRLSQILAASLAVYCSLSSITLWLQGLPRLSTGYALASGAAVLWVLISHFIIRKVDVELVLEVARILYPVGAILTVTLSILLAFELNALLELAEGRETELEFLVLILAGVMIAIFLCVRMLDIRFMRSAEEIRLMLRASRAQG